MRAGMADHITDGMLTILEEEDVDWAEQAVARRASPQPNRAQCLSSENDRHRATHGHAKHRLARLQLLDSPRAINLAMLVKESKISLIVDLYPLAVLVLHLTKLRGA
jgi:hypothetical protein